MVYAAVGYLTGIIRRLIGLLTVYGAFLSATYLNTGLSQQVLNFQPFTAPTDARLYAYLGVMAIVILAVEGLAAGYNERLQLAVVVLNRFTGFVVGLFTGVVLAGFLVFVINGYANPAGGTLSDNQVKMRTAYSSSALAPVVLGLVHPLRGFFAPVLPRDPTTFFNTAHD